MSSLLQRVESELLPNVAKPMRYAGAELNAVRKDLGGVSLHGVFCFPDIYDIGMSHHGLQILYHRVNSVARFALSRAFHPWTDAEAIMREKRIPLWSLEYGMPLSQADWLGFTLQYELQAAGVLNMLDLGGLAVRCADRATAWPVVVAGGPCAANPEPLADFVDAFAIGDGEESVIALCETLERLKQQAADRPQVLAALGALPGMYVPALHPTRRTGRFVVPDLSARPAVKAAKVTQLKPEYYPPAPLVPLVDVVHHRLAVEVMRGCTRGCRFCSAGMLYRPVRERSPQDISRQTSESIAATGWREVGLLSLSTADHTRFSEILSAAASVKERDRIDFSVPSTRIDSMGPAQLDLLQSLSHASSFTLAPEAGTERLRRAVNKGFSDKDIHDAVAMLVDHRVLTVKLYFMVGLPTETWDDVKGVVSLVEGLSQLARERSRRVVLHVALSPFSPKAHTPFQWEAMDTVASLTEKAAFVRRSLSPRRNVKVSYRDAAVTRLETVLARGDRRVGSVVHAAWKHGARLDGWDELLRVESWEQAAVEAGVVLDDYTTEIAQEEVLPWCGVDIGINARFLTAERQLSRQAVMTGDCRLGACGGCGVCSLAPRQLLDRPAAPAAAVAATGQATTFGRKPRVQPAAEGRYHVRVVYRKGPAVRFLGHRDLMSVLQRALVAADVPLEYSSGFHPHPRMSFGPPLPLSVAGEAEQLDLTLTERKPLDLTVTNRFLPQGMALISSRMLALKPQSLNVEMVAGRYRFSLLAEKPVVDLKAAAIALLASTRLVVTADREGETITKDIRPLVYELVVIDDSACAFEALLATLPGNTCSPGNLVAGLFPGTGLRLYDFMVTRAACYRKEGERFVDMAQ